MPYDDVVRAVNADRRRAGTAELRGLGTLAWLLAIMWVVIYAAEVALQLVGLTGWSWATPQLTPVVRPAETLLGYAFPPERAEETILSFPVRVAVVMWPPMLALLVGRIARTLLHAASEVLRSRGAQTA